MAKSKTETTKSSNMQNAGHEIFRRKARVGFNLLKPEVGQSYFLEIIEIDTMISKQYGELEYATVLDLNTGEEFRMWLDGALKHNFSKFILPAKVEIIKKEKISAFVEIDGKMTEKDVNNYDMWTLE